MSFEWALNILWLNRIKSVAIVLCMLAERTQTMKYTIFTPTYNRIDTLPRVYLSLINQTYKDFIWLIIDDGSTDNTANLIDKWKADNKINIKYFYKENGGKHSAMKLAYEKSTTKYIIELHSDDEILPKTIAIFNDHWELIESQRLETKIANISGLSAFNNSKIVGSYYIDKCHDFIDMSWHEMVLKYNINNENITCWNLNKLRQCVNIQDKFWFSDRIKNLMEFVLWARLGRKYKTRWINQVLRIYHTDAETRLSTLNNKNMFYKNLVGTKFFVDENIKYFFWKPKYFLNLILKFSISGINLGIKKREIYNNISNKNFKFLYSILLPVSYIANSYFKNIRKQYWYK